MRSTKVVEGDAETPERLDRWIRSQTRGWREIAETLLRAGRRLAADHAAGTTYDDVRVDHILVAADGEVTFTGLIPAESAGAPSSGPGEEIRSAALSLQQRLAVSDAVHAAAYLAPERFRGGPGTNATNQFSFCVVMYWCFFDKMPFDADAGVTSPLTRHTPLGSVSFSLLLASLDRTTFVNVAREILAGNVRPPDHASEVPLWVFTIIKRGLSPDSEDRYPTLGALLDDFEHHLTGRNPHQPAARRFRLPPPWALALGGLGLLFLLAVLTLTGK